MFKRKKTAAKTKTPTKKAKASKSTGAKGSADRQVLVRKPDVFSRKNTDGTVAIMNLDVDTHFFVLDQLAAEFWLMIDGKRSVSEIEGKLAKKAKASLEALTKESRKLVQQLKKEGLVIQK